MTLKINLKPTDKLFFKKYPYKIDFNIVGASLIRAKGLEWAKEFAKDLKLKAPYYMREASQIDRMALSTFIQTIEPYLEKAEEFQTRTEINRFTYYSKDLQEIESLAKELDWCMSEVWGPQDQLELDFLLANKRKLLCDAIPYSKYRFKIILKSSVPVHSRTQFLTWANNYTEDDIKISRGTSSWLKSTRRYCQTPFFYLADEKMLTFASIFLSNNISTIQEYFPRHNVI